MKYSGAINVTKNLLGRQLKPFYALPPWGGWTRVAGWSGLVRGECELMQQRKVWKRDCCVYIRIKGKEEEQII